MKRVEEIKQAMMDVAASYYGRMIVGRLVDDRMEESSNYHKYVAVAALLKGLYEVEEREIQDLAYGRYGAEMCKAEENPEKYREDEHDFFKWCDILNEKEG